jgi:hypothetical protein
LLFIIELRRGIEVKIPTKLSQSGFSYAYQYYDAIINIVKTNILTADENNEVE